MKRHCLFGIALLLFVSSCTASAQLLRQLPNADFSRWRAAEPTGWHTNNVYDEQGTLQQTLVKPLGTSGVQLLAKRVVYRTDVPVIDAWYGGQLWSALVPYMPEVGKPIALTIRYRFRPDSADVLQAEVRLESRDKLPDHVTPDPACACRFSGADGPLILSPTTTSVTVRAQFVGATSAARPPGCAMYVWKIRFWLTNATTHPHEGTEAIIEQISLEP
ncbi:hypothetical protein [uncultured Fibrella sp.]|uniref:hypothetical protein n=1 Tax=uncultured Fibrella sp. TaxID=1284596 RepID=UPI0035C9D443